MQNKCCKKKTKESTITHDQLTLYHILQIKAWISNKYNQNHKKKVLVITHIVTTYENCGNVVWKFFGTKSKAGCIEGSATDGEEDPEQKTQHHKG